MKHKELFKLLDEVQEQGEETIVKKHDKLSNSYLGANINAYQI